MSSPALDFSTLTTEEIPDGVPNHRASSGETGEKPRMAASRLFGRTGGASSNRATNTRPPKRERESPPPLKPGMKGQLSDFYQGVGAMLRPFDELLGDTIIEQADKCADSVYKLAQTNDAVRRAILAFATTSASGAVIMAHLPIFLVAARHSKSDRVRSTAMGTMIAVRMMEANEAQRVFSDDADSDGDNA